MNAIKKITLIVSFLFIASANANLEEIFGNAEVGDSCASDYQCATLCCNEGTKTCGDHNSQSSIRCNKPVGESCVTSEYCKKEYVPVCRLYKTGASTTGVDTCEMRCPPQELSGSCVNNVCRAARVPPVPVINPADPCAGAIDPYKNNKIK